MNEILYKEALGSRGEIWGSFLHFLPVFFEILKYFVLVLYIYLLMFKKQALYSGG